MARPYSTDLREKVLGHLEKNSDKKAASDLFQVGIATIYRWVALKKKRDIFNLYKENMRTKELMMKRYWSMLRLIPINSYLKSESVFL